MLEEVLKLCQETKTDTTNLRSTLGTVEQDVSEIKTQVAGIEMRVITVEENATKLTTRVAVLETRVREKESEMEARLEKKILAKLQAQTPKRPLPQPTSTTLDVGKPPSPILGGNKGKKIHAAFQELLRTAESRKNTFLVGIIEQYTENGAQLRPLISYDRIVRRFFHGLWYKMGALGRAQSTGMPLGKITVHNEDIHEAKLHVPDRWRETRDWLVGGPRKPARSSPDASKCLPFYHVCKESV
jgi:hypothetical protein